MNLYDMADLCTPWCLHVAATLEIAEKIAAGTDRISDLARAAGCDREALHEMLGHLVGKGVFEEPEPGRFALNDLAKQLLEPAMHVGLDLDGIGGRMAHIWSTMLAYVQTGRTAFAQVFGRPFWEDLEANPKVAESFDALIGIVGHGTPDPRFPLTIGWEKVRRVVDVGGGTGAMLAEVLRAHPHVRGTLVDVPRTVARAAPVLEAAGVSDRATVAGQSFFDALPAGADVYLVRGVLNDWPDAEATTILRRCAEAAGPDGRVVVLKSLRADRSPRTLGVEMLLCGGRSRTLEELRGIAHEAGLVLLGSGRQEAGHFWAEFGRSVRAQ